PQLLKECKIRSASERHGTCERKLRVGQSRDVIDLGVDVELSHLVKQRRVYRRRTHAPADLMADPGRNPTAHLQAIRSKPDTIDDLGPGLGVRFLHGADEIAEQARLAGELTQCEREIARLFDRVDARNNRRGKSADLAADPDAAIRAHQVTNELAMT